MRRRVWLIGENNPYGSDDRFALYPWPQGCSGQRLCFKILGMTEERYLASFERRNLLAQEKWSVAAAREAAGRIRTRLVDGDTLVLCGAKVAKAFGYAYAPLESHEERAPNIPFGHAYANGRTLPRSTSFTAIVIPHPSGLNRAWADPTLATRVREKVLELLESSRG